jgi:hypothetical protein
VSLHKHYSLDVAPQLDRASVHSLVGRAVIDSVLWVMWNERRLILCRGINSCTDYKMTYCCKKKGYALVPSSKIKKTCRKKEKSNTSNSLSLFLLIVPTDFLKWSPRR